MKNKMLEEVEYKTVETKYGKWRLFMYENGRAFKEFTSHLKFGNLPLLHYTFGICPETGGRITAKGVFAVGRRALGLVAVGQLAVGIIAIGQLALGLLFCMGQLSVAYIAVGQLAIAYKFALGQIAIAVTVIAQLGVGENVLAQAGWGHNLWTQKIRNPEAVKYFEELLGNFTKFIGK